jgi:hypothetical protein
MPAGVGPDGPLNLGAGFAVERVRGLWARPCEHVRFGLAVLYKCALLTPTQSGGATLSPEMVRLLIELLADGTLITEHGDDASVVTRP